MKRAIASKRTDIQIHADHSHMGPLAKLGLVICGQTAVRGASLSAKTFSGIRHWLDENTIPHKLSLDGGSTWIERFSPDWNTATISPRGD